MSKIPCEIATMQCDPAVTTSADHALDWNSPIGPRPFMRLSGVGYSHVDLRGRGEVINEHPCQHRDTPDAVCRQIPSFQALGAVEIEQKRAKRLVDVRRDAPRYVALFRRAYSGKSRLAAMKAMCVECMGFDAAEVRNCSAPACPLFPYRPGKRKVRMS